MIEDYKCNMVHYAVTHEISVIILKRIDKYAYVLPVLSTSEWRKRREDDRAAACNNIPLLETNSLANKVCLRASDS